MTTVNARIILIRTTTVNSGIYINELRIISNGVNVALNKTATSSTLFAGHVVENAIDSHINTATFAIPDVTPAFWRVDLGANYTVDEIIYGKGNINIVTNNIKNIVLEVFSDVGETSLEYTTPIDSNISTSKFNDFSSLPLPDPLTTTFNPINGRIVRLRKLKKGEIFVINDINVTSASVNVAFGKEVFISLSNGLSKTHINDNNNFTRLTARTLPNEFAFVYIDLGSTYQLERIIVNIRSPTLINDVVIEVFNDINLQNLVFMGEFNTTSNQQIFNDFKFIAETLNFTNADPTAVLLPKSIRLDVEELNAENIANVSYNTIYLDNTNALGNLVEIEIKGNTLTQTNLDIERTFLFKSKRVGALPAENFIRLLFNKNYFEPPYEIDVSIVDYFYVEFQTTGQAFNVIWDGQTWFMKYLCAAIISHVLL
jgi:hypothetical protein